MNARADGDTDHDERPDPPDDVPDGLQPEARYHLEPADTMTPERLFEQQWAVTLLDKVLARLQAEMTSGGKAALFDALKGCLGGSKDETYAATAASLGSSSSGIQTISATPAAVTAASARLRRR